VRISMGISHFFCNSVLSNDCLWGSRGQLEGVSGLYVYIVTPSLYSISQTALTKTTRLCFINQLNFKHVMSRNHYSVSSMLYKPIEKV